MSNGSGRPSWYRAFEARLFNFQQSDLSLGQMALMWAAAITVVLLACAVFFFGLYWLFS